MKTHKFWLVLSLVLAALMLACSSSDDSDDGEEAADVISVAIGAADNLMIGSGGTASQSLFSSLAPRASAGANSGLLTADNSGDVRGVGVAHGDGSTPKPSKIHKIKRRGQGASKVKGALEFCGGDPRTCAQYVVDKSDRAHKLKRKPKAGSNRLRKAAMFYEREGKIYYPDENDDLIELDVSEDAPEKDVYRVVRSGVVQAVMNKSGDWMLELTDGKVKHRRDSDGAETRMNGQPLTFDPTVDINYKSDAENQKFFFSHSRASENGGFMFMSQYGLDKDFWRVREVSRAWRP